MEVCNPPLNETNRTLTAKYGLPTEVKFCKKCVISNQRPNSEVEFLHTLQSKKKTIHFDNDGVCDACQVSAQKRTIHWQEREQELRALCDKHRGDGTYYDCLIPGSGGKDSFYAAHLLKYQYNMRPLTVTWAPHLYTPWGWQNFQAWLKAGFDNYLMTPNPRVHRLLTRIAIENLFHPFQPFILGQKNLAPKMAKLFNIPLIFYGENEAEYGNPISDTQQSLRDQSYYTYKNIKDVYLGGESTERLLSDYGLEHYEIEPYLPLHPEALEQTAIEVHYLGYYLKWHPQSCYYYAVENGGFQASPERTPGTYSKYNSIDDKIDDFHYYTTYIKFGIGRATYDAAQEIRSGDITREEGIALVKRYDGEFPNRFADEIFAYLSIPEKEYPMAAKKFQQAEMTKEYFAMLCDKFRSEHLWKKVDGIWQLRHTVFQHDQ